MHWDGKRLRFSAGDLVTFATSDFASWMDRWWVERERGNAGPLPVLRDVAAGAAHDLPLFSQGPRRVALDCTPESPDADAQLLLDRGRAHERAVLDGLRASGLHIVEVEPGRGARAATQRAFAADAPVVYQALLDDVHFICRPDFLLRRAGAQAGTIDYEPADAKLARSVKPEHVVQLCLYARLLAEVQRVRPRAASVMLGDGRTEHIDLDRYAHYVDRLIATFLATQEAFDARHMPHPGTSLEAGRWAACAEAIIAETDHLRGVAGIRADQIRKLERAGITTLTQLAGWTATPGEVAAWDAEPVVAIAARKGPRAMARKRGGAEAATEVAAGATPRRGPSPLRIAPGIRASTLVRLSTQARLQIESRGLAIPRWEVRPHPEPDVRRGFALLPPASPSDVFFDMEGHPLADHNLEYLFGAVHHEGDALQFAEWWALTIDAEREAFEGFVDWVFERWQRDPRMHVYHYANYEVAALRRLMGAHGSREHVVDELLRNEVLVDLYQVVQQGLVIGGAGYSLKNIEPLYAPARAGTVRTAEGCMAAFERWLDKPDGRTHDDSATLAAIRAYNRDDCESTWRLATWLREVQAGAGIAWVPSRREADREHGIVTASAVPDPVADPASASAAVRTSTVLQAMATASTDPEQVRVATLLAHLIDFHRREWKPAWWRIFDRAGKTSEELEHDFECLAGLERVGPLTNTASDWDYRWDPDQETKLEAGDLCCFASDIDAEVRIEMLDPDGGRLRLRPERNLFAAPERIDLVLKDIVRPWTVANAVLRYAQAWADGRRAAPALDDFLHRRPPRIAGHPGGAIAPAGPQFDTALSRAVRDLENSTLCIQGPPGTGKTHTASRLVLEAARAGRIVGVLANSHKVIDHFIRAVLQRADEAGIAVGGDAGLRVVKIGGEPDPATRDAGNVEFVAENAKVREVLQSQPEGQGLVVGGTAWCFARAPEQSLDLLFVDEAGQVALANLIGAGLAARNLVLVGDQMQLAQPIVGAHPGDSGQSGLDYLLQGRATIPDEFGVFLGTTRRMHPSICTFISDAVYDGRLQADPITSRRHIELGGHVGTRTLHRASGVVWLPVPHEGNSQCSDEEADVVERVVHELLAATWHDASTSAGTSVPVGARPRSLRLSDILIVAPYNMQVRRIQRRLRARYEIEPRVGSVDRFQGQEAPAVIVSMCASSIEDVPRGLEFLLSPNRLNVAVSRAQSLAVVVGSPALLSARCKTLDQMRLLDLYCRLVEYAERSRN